MPTLIETTMQLDREDELGLSEITVTGRAYAHDCVEVIEGITEDGKKVELTEDEEAWAERLFLELLEKD